MFVLSSLAAGFAGVLYASRFGAMNPAALQGEELTVIAAAILGGTSLFGGAGPDPGMVCCERLHALQIKAHMIASSGLCRPARGSPQIRRPFTGPMLSPAGFSVQPGPPAYGRSRPRDCILAFSTSEKSRR